MTAKLNNYWLVFHLAAIQNCETQAQVYSAWMNLSRWCNNEKLRRAMEAKLHELSYGK